MMDLDGLEKLTSNSIEFNNKSVEETLIEIGRYALFAVRIPGYLPLTTIRSHLGLQLDLVRCSTSTFYTIFITIFCIIGNGFFAHTFIDKFFISPHNSAESQNGEAVVVDDEYGNTEAFIWISLLTLVCYTSYLRITRIFFTSKNSLKYWKKTMTLVESFVTREYNLSSKGLYNISKSCRNWTIFYILIGIFRISYSTYNLYDHVRKESNNIDLNSLKALCLDIFLALTLCFHVGFSIWLTFLIKILIFCYETIHDDLNKNYYTVVAGNSNSIGGRLENNFKLRRSTTMTTSSSSRLSSSFHLPSTEDNLRDIHSRNTSANIRSGCGNISSTVQNTNMDLNGCIEIEEKIQKTINSYEAIEKQMHSFNKTFGTSILLETAFNFFLLIVNVYAGQVFLKLQLDEILFVTFTMIIPIIIFSTSIYHFATECSILSGKAVSILKKLEAFFIKTERLELQILQLKVVAFIARVADNPPNITASHFFSINRHLLTSMLGTVTTYLIVLLQFRQAGLPNSNRNVTNNSYPPCPEDRYWTCQCSPQLVSLNNNTLPFNVDSRNISTTY